MISERIKDCRIFLASQSPRRHYLMKELGLDFTVVESLVPEQYPAGLSPDGIAVYLAELKSMSTEIEPLGQGAVLVTADTIVSIGNEILGKPSGPEEAAEMLGKLSGQMHEVITAVCLRSVHQKRTFHVTSAVWFKELTSEEIAHYIHHFRPFDKAGSYGAQEWIGYIGISKIEGSYFNVMGLPVKELYEELIAFCANNS